MPITIGFSSEIDTDYFEPYIENLSGAKAEKRRVTIRKFKRMLSNAARNEADDHRLINIILEMGEEADAIQGELGQVHYSNASELLHFVKDEVRDHVDATILENEIDRRKNELKSKKTEYIKVKKSGTTTKDILTREMDIYACIKKLAYLGDLSELIKLPISIIKETYPASRPWYSPTRVYGVYEYSDSSTVHGVEGIITCVPLMIQKKFRSIWLRKNNKDVKRTPPPPEQPSVSPIEHKEDHSRQPTPVAPKNIISEKCYSQIINDFDNYTEPVESKQSAITEVKALIMQLWKNKATANEWLDAVGTLGKKAYEAQMQSRTGLCSSCAELFYYEMHSLRMEVALKAPDDIQKRHQLEYKNLADIQKKADEAKSSSKDVPSILQQEANVFAQVRHMAYLGDSDPLLALPQSIVDQMFSGYEKTSAIGIVVSYLSSKPYGYRKSETAHPFSLGLALPQSESANEPIFCIHLPQVLQPAFIIVYEVVYKLNKRIDEITIDITSIDVNKPQDDVTVSKIREKIAYVKAVITMIQGSKEADEFTKRLGPQEREFARILEILPKRTYSAVVASPSSSPQVSTLARLSVTNTRGSRDSSPDSNEQQWNAAPTRRGRRRN